MYWCGSGGRVKWIQAIDDKYFWFELLNFIDVRFYTLNSYLLFESKVFMVSIQIG